MSCRAVMLIGSCGVKEMSRLDLCRAFHGASCHTKHPAVLHLTISSAVK